MRLPNPSANSSSPRVLSHLPLGAFRRASIRNWRYPPRSFRSRGSSPISTWFSASWLVLERLFHGCSFGSFDGSIQFIFSFWLFFLSRSAGKNDFCRKLGFIDIKTGLWSQLVCPMCLNFFCNRRLGDFYGMGNRLSYIGDQLFELEILEPMTLRSRDFTVVIPLLIVLSYF